MGNLNFDTLRDTVTLPSVSDILSNGVCHNALLTTPSSPLVGGEVDPTLSLGILHNESSA